MTAPSPFWRAQEPTAKNVRQKPGSGARKAPDTGQSSKKGKRYVRTDAGARRYRQPIGTEIGDPRNREAAKAQKNPGARNHYNSLVGADPKKQAAAFKWFDNARLQNLSRVAYSFPSSNPDVVRLRIGIANELKRRGMDVNDFGGLGRGSRAPAAPSKAKARPAPQAKRKPLPPKPRPKTKKKPAPSATRSNFGGAQRKMIGLSNVADLRRAVAVFSRVAPDKRQAVARLLVQTAIDLSAPNLLGRSVVEAANVERGSELGQQVIELAGRWKHGWVPLDATAMRSKMKGGNGKPWWSGGKTKRRGSASMRKAVEGGRAARAGKESRVPTKRTTVVNSGATPQSTQGAKVNAIPKMTPEQLRTERQTREAMDRGVAARRAKSGPDLTGATESDLNIRKRTLEGVAARKQPTKAQQREYAAVKAELARRQAAAKPVPRVEAKPAAHVSNETRERELLSALRRRLERVGGDKSRLSSKERRGLDELTAKYGGGSGKA